ncbi:BnaAnng25540D [Brassica napus]|uniref:(rape) hypothetical protein n=1 Tax=Brassica napus TaxID=3708 RepID=A0A078JN57_BRANA|nr:unnamed protein product [Brassica napus]CDY67915.1 BnaAnng25540D [Brassica napus]
MVSSHLSADVMSLVDTLPVLAKTAVAPLERIKILLQTRTNHFRSLGYVPLWFHNSYYETGRVLLGLSLPLGSGPVVDLVAGSAAGGTAVLCTYPLDLARTKLAYQVSDTGQSFRGGTNGFYRQPPYSGITMAYKEGGPRGLYRGIGPTLTGILPYAGLKFYIYEELKRHVPEEHQNASTLWCFSWFIWPDLDLPIRCCQETNAGGESAAYDGQLFAGLSINYIKVNPIQRFAVYESMKSWLRIPPRERSKPA